MRKKREGWVNTYFDTKDNRVWTSALYRSPEEAALRAVKDFIYSRFIATEHMVIEWEDAE